MTMSKVGIAVLIATAIAISGALDCSRVVTKESQGILNWLGMINFTVPVSSGPAGWSLTLVFDRNFTGVGVWDGFVNYNGTQGWAQISNRNETDAQLEAGQRKAMRFRVNYLDRFVPIPQVVSLRFQDVELCQ